MKFSFTLITPWCYICVEWQPLETRLLEEQPLVSRRLLVWQGWWCRTMGDTCSLQIFPILCRPSKDSTRNHSSLKVIKIYQQSVIIVLCGTALLNLLIQKFKIVKLVSLTSAGVLKAVKETSLPVCGVIICHCTTLAADGEQRTC